MAKGSFWHLYTGSDRWPGGDLVWWTADHFWPTASHGCDIDSTCQRNPCFWTGRSKANRHLRLPTLQIWRYPQLSSSRNHLWSTAQPCRRCLVFGGASDHQPFLHSMHFVTSVPKNNTSLWVNSETFPWAVFPRSLMDNIVGFVKDMGRNIFWFNWLVLSEFGPRKCSPLQNPLHCPL